MKKLLSYLEFLNESKKERAFDIYYEYYDTGGSYGPAEVASTYNLEIPISRDLEDFITYCVDHLYHVDKEPKEEDEEEYDEEYRSDRKEPAKKLTLEELKQKFQMFKQFWKLNIEFPVNIKDFLTYYYYGEKNEHDKDHDRDNDYSYYQEYGKHLPNYLKHLYDIEDLTDKEGIEKFFNMFNTKYSRLIGNNRKFKKYF